MFSIYFKRMLHEIICFLYCPIIFPPTTETLKSCYQAKSICRKFLWLKNQRSNIKKRPLRQQMLPTSAVMSPIACDGCLIWRFAILWQFHCFQYWLGNWTFSFNCSRHLIFLMCSSWWLSSYIQLLFLYSYNWNWCHC